jgi:3-hydroxyacyl-CoA dehydrogenase
MEIKKVAVIGAGVMGASIAAHISNAGVPVYLLDIVPEDAKNRNIIAETAVKKLLAAEPAPLMHKNNARLITPGNIEDHLDSLADADWVIEAVIEDPRIKKVALPEAGIGLPR